MSDTVLSALDAQQLYAQQFNYYPHFADGLPMLAEWISGSTRIEIQAGWLRNLSSSPLHCAASQCFFVTQMIGCCSWDSLSSRAVFISFHPTVFLSVIYLEPGICFDEDLREWGRDYSTKTRGYAGREVQNYPLPPLSFPFILLSHSSSTRYLFTSAIEGSKGLPSFPPSLIFLPCLAASSSLPNLL